MRERRRRTPSIAPLLRGTYHPVARDAVRSMLCHHFLLVSHQESLARSLVPTVLGQGDRLTLAASPFDALTSLQAAKPDAFLVAFDEEDPDSPVVCRTLRRQSNLPIVMLVNSGTREQVVRGYGFGADAHIEIPCDPRIFRARLSAILRQSPEPEPQPQPELVTPFQPFALIAAWAIGSSSSTH